MNSDHIQVVAFDADDTLWETGPMFQAVSSRFLSMFADDMESEELQKKLLAIEISNLKRYGYGVKSFVLSMIETAVDIRGEMMVGDEIRTILEMGKEMLTYPIDVLDGVEEVLTTLRRNYRLMVITKGDPVDQESKLERSKLGGYFSTMEVVTEKNKGTYHSILSRHSIQSCSFLMVGDSLKSDILPVVAVGGNAVYIPTHPVWAHEQVTLPFDHEKVYLELDHILELLPLFDAGLSGLDKRTGMAGA